MYYTNLGYEYVIPVSNTMGTVCENNCNVPDIKGITVKGSESQQLFAFANAGQLEGISHVISLQLCGKSCNTTQRETCNFTCTVGGKESKAPLAVALVVGQI